MTARTTAPDGAAPWVPEARTLPSLHAAAQACRGCDLYREATQAVTGDGPVDARLVLVGEQPGDQEDRAGEPFVGPAGRLLDKALEEAGLARDQVFVTNAVKHFRFETKGKRRIHQSPTRWQVAACQPWLLAELDLVRPAGVVLLGATAGVPCTARRSASAPGAVGRSRGPKASGSSSPPPGCSRRRTPPQCCAPPTGRARAQPSSAT